MPNCNDKLHMIQGKYLDDFILFYIIHFTINVNGVGKDTTGRCFMRWVPVLLYNIGLFNWKKILRIIFFLE